MNFLNFYFISIKILISYNKKYINSLLKFLNWLKRMKGVLKFEIKNINR